MPQLDLVTYNITSSLLLASFWTYFTVLYVAVSYTSQKISAAYYFKFYTILSSILIVYALEVNNSNLIKNNNTIGLIQNKI
jgi:hypothetical protein